MKRSVLAIGLDPSFVDLTASGLTPQVIKAYIDAQVEKLNSSGYDARSCLTDLGDTAEWVVTSALKSKPYDCVVIGAGLRQPQA